VISCGGGSAVGVAERGLAEAAKPRLLDRVRVAVRLRHYSRRTEKAYVAWVRRYVLFHGKRHPKDMGAAELTQFLSSLALNGRVAASTQNQALSGLLFLYREVLEIDVPWLAEIVRAKRPERLPVVLTRNEVRAVLRPLRGAPRLMAFLLYGSGLRVLECCRLRVQDVDFGANQIVVRGAKGDKDRVTVLPSMIKRALAQHLETVREQHQCDLRSGAGWVELPTALARKYPNAGREWVWQWVFPATRFYRDRDSGQLRRHDLHESVLQRIIKEPCGAPALRSGPPRTRFATPSRHICSKRAATSELSRSFSAIAMSRRRRSTRTFSTAALAPYAARSIRCWAPEHRDAVRTGLSNGLSARLSCISLAGSHHDGARSGQDATSYRQRKAGPRTPALRGGNIPRWPTGFVAIR
jgi:integron integrase